MPDSNSLLLRRLAAACAAMCISPALMAATTDDPETDRIAGQVVDSVRLSIAAGNCDAAVYHLKSGLKSNRPKVALLAGTMYETGLCVKRDWEAAVGYYALAYDGGLMKAAQRLAAGYAEPANGPDTAAALWWGRQGHGVRLAYCEVGQDAAADPDRFVAELGTWQPSRLAACNYIVGVMSTVGAEVVFPELAGDFGLGGNVSLRFVPSQAKFEIKMGEGQEYAMLGVLDGDAVRFRHTKDKTGVFEKAVSDVANRALARYPQPKGIPAGLTVDTQYTFSIQHR